MAINNHCSFIGRLGRDPETRYTQSGDAVCNFSVAVDESYKGKDGQKVDKTEWVNCVAWRKLGEICGQYLTKGSLVAVSGKMQTRKWQDKDGNDRYTTEILLDEMRMLGSKGENSQSTSNNDQGYYSPPAEPPKRQDSPAPIAQNDMDDDIPF